MSSERECKHHGMQCTIVAGLARLQFVHFLGMIAINPLRTCYASLVGCILWFRKRWCELAKHPDVCFREQATDLLLKEPLLDFELFEAGLGPYASCASILTQTGENNEDEDCQTMPVAVRLPVLPPLTCPAFLLQDPWSHGSTILDLVCMCAMLCTGMLWRGGACYSDSQPCSARVAVRPG